MNTITAHILKLSKTLNLIFYHEIVSLLLLPLPMAISSSFCKSCLSHPTTTVSRSLKQRMKVMLGYSRQLPHMSIGLSSLGRTAVGWRKRLHHWQGYRGLQKDTLPLGRLSSKGCLPDTACLSCRVRKQHTKTEHSLNKNYCAARLLAEEKSLLMNM